MSAGLSGLKPSLETYGNQSCSVRLEGAVVVGGVGRGGRCASTIGSKRETGGVGLCTDVCSR